MSESLGRIGAFKLLKRLATGGTAAAKIKLVEKLGGKVVGVAFLIELAALGGRDKLPGYDVFSVLTY